MVREVESSRRVFVRLAEDAQAEVVGVDWQVDVHTHHRLSEELRIRAYGYPVPEDLAADYLDFHAAFLEAVQIYSFGCDRLLEAAIIIGPSGRTNEDLSAPENSQFESLVGESLYYMVDAELLVGRVQDDLRDIFQSLRIR